MTQDQALQEYSELVRVNQEKYGMTFYKKGFERTLPDSEIPLEHHHVIPRGKNFGGTDIPSNMVWLSVEDHIRAHELLTLIYPKSRGLRSQFSTMKNETEESRAEKCVKATKGRFLKQAGLAHDPDAREKGKATTLARQAENAPLVAEITRLWKSLPRELAETVIEYKFHRGIHWIRAQKVEILEYYLEELKKLANRRN